MTKTMENRRLRDAARFLNDYLVALGTVVEAEWVNFGHETNHYLVAFLPPAKVRVVATPLSDLLQEDDDGRPQPTWNVEPAEVRPEFTQMLGAMWIHAPNNG
jgi:hypothetical protein